MTIGFIGEFWFETFGKSAQKLCVFVTNTKQKPSTFCQIQDIDGKFVSSQKFANFLCFSNKNWKIEIWWNELPGFKNEIL